MCDDVSVKVRWPGIFHSLLLPCGALRANPGYRLSGKCIYELSHHAGPMLYFICEYITCSLWLIFYEKKRLANRKSQEMGPMYPGLGFCWGCTVWFQARSFPITKALCVSLIQKLPSRGVITSTLLIFFPLAHGPRDGFKAQHCTGLALSTSQGLLPPGPPLLYPGKPLPPFPLLTHLRSHEEHICESMTQPVLTV